MLSEHTASDGSKAHEFSQILRLSWLWFSWDRDRIVHELLSRPKNLGLCWGTQPLYQSTENCKFNRGVKIINQSINKSNHIKPNQ